MWFTDTSLIYRKLFSKPSHWKK